jgi:hypothetical protein
MWDSTILFLKQKYDAHQKDWEDQFLGGEEGVGAMCDLVHCSLKQYLVSKYII